MQRITLIVLGFLLVGLTAFPQSEATLESSMQINITNIKSAYDLDAGRRLLTFDLQLSTAEGLWSTIELTAHTYSHPRAGSSDISQLILWTRKISNAVDGDSGYQGMFLFSIEDYCKYGERVLLGIDVEAFGLSTDQLQVYREMKAFHLDRSICD